MLDMAGSEQSKGKFPTLKQPVVSALNKETGEFKDNKTIGHGLSSSEN